MKLMRGVLVALVLLSLARLAAGNALEPPVAKVTRDLDAALDSASAIQQQSETWAKEQPKLAAGIRQLKMRLRRLQMEITKYDQAISRQRKTIADLEREADQVSRTSSQLQPFMKSVVARLEKFVAADLPFQREERKRRLRFLRDTLNDYHLEAGEKLRRLLEALQAEAGYGRELEATDEAISLDGETVFFHVLRIGRAALFCVSPDGRRAGRYDRTIQRWVPLDPGYADGLMMLREMINGQRPMDLVMVPVGKAVEHAGPTRQPPPKGRQP